MPASTSPVPAVASHGLVVALIEALPSGAATTVSAPLSSTMAPERADGGAGAVELGTPRQIAEQPREFAVMRREHDGRGARADGGEQRVRRRRRTR